MIKARLGFSILVAVLMVSFSCAMPRIADATWMFVWEGDGLEWWSNNDPINPVNGNSYEHPWTGYFTIPDSAVSLDSGRLEGYADLSKYLDFSFEGIFASGTFMEAMVFNSDPFSQLQVIYDKNSNILSLMNMGNSIDFLMEDPFGFDDPVHVFMDAQIGPMWYMDKVFDTNTSSWVDVSVAHIGDFVGYYVNDAYPVPEPSTFILLGGGILGILGIKTKKSRKQQ